MEARTQTMSRMAEGHRSLLARATATGCHCPDAVLNLGLALELHRSAMGFVPESARALLDENVLDELAAEGGSILENLAHLASLRESEPDAPEIDAFAAALLERIRAHLKRHDRAVFRPLSRFYPESQWR